MNVATSYGDFLDGPPFDGFSQERRQGGTSGLTLIEIEQGAVEFERPPMAEVVFGRILRAEGPGETDFGEGWVPRPLHAGTVDVQPPSIACGFRLPPLTMRMAVMPLAVFEAHLRDTGVTVASLRAVTGCYRRVPEAARLMDAIWHASAHGGLVADLQVDGLFLQFVAALLDACGNCAVFAPVPSVGNWRIARAVEHVEAHPDRSLPVEALAEIAGMSPHHFSRTFAAATGFPPHRYVVNRRIRLAKILLSDTDRPIAEIALACGFSSQSHMTDLMRERLGVAPAQFRREMRG